jgi:hypothetical protein
MDYIRGKFQHLVAEPSDINGHLMTLARYSSKCVSVLELGVRGCVSSWAFLLGLLYNNHPTKHLIMNDIKECNVDDILEKARAVGVQIEYNWCNDLNLDIGDTPIDMVFIDTWHVYGQLKRELAKYGKIARKFIVMHDTTVDEIDGETIRLGFDPIEQSKESGFPVDEILKGLRPAILEFLRENPNWVIEEKFAHNNGLTILKRIG